MDNLDLVLIKLPASSTPIEIFDDQKEMRHYLHNIRQEADGGSLARKSKTSICVIADDTDVFILLIHFYSEQQLTCSLAINDGYKFRQEMCGHPTTTKKGKKNTLKSLEVFCLLMCCLTVKQYQDCGVLEKEL